MNWEYIEQKAMHINDVRQDYLTVFFFILQQLYNLTPSL